MRKRNLSEFMCIEMLYDYKSEKLDPLRKQAVDECIQNSPRAREELKKLTHGLQYIDRLKEVRVSEPLIELINNYPKPSQKLLQKLSWGQLPQPLRWGIEGIVVAVAVVLFAFQYDKLFKSDKLKEQSVIYKKFEIESGDQKEVPRTATSEPVLAKEEKHVYQEQPLLLTQSQNPPIVVTEDAAILAKNESPTKPTTDAEKASAVAATSTVSIAGTESKINQSAAQGNAYLYRMVMYVENVDKITPEIVSYIKSLGAEKAGEVELGWRRKGGSYFHFSMPQINNSKLVEYLKKYSPVNIAKSNHPRVMPAGTERFILWIEERKAQDAAGTNLINEGTSQDGNQDSH